MSFVTNEWLPVCGPQQSLTTILRITGVYEIDVYVSSDDVPDLRKYSWCYEQAKGNVYTMDASLELSKLLGITSPRVYLWKYIVYKHTGKIAKSWRRIDKNDYRFNHGVIEYISPVSVSDIAGA